MKVYCIHNTLDYVPRLERIFSTREKAEKFLEQRAEEYGKHWADYFYIEEETIE